MQNFENIEKLWAKHHIDLEISAEQMLKQVKKEVNAIRTKSILNILGMLLSLSAISILWFCFNFKSVYTHIGLSIIIIAIAIYTIILYTHHRMISQNDFTVNPSIFLQKLKNYKAQQQKLYSRLYWFYVGAISIGLGLYLFEILKQLSVWGQYTAIMLSVGWVIFCSTYLRKATIKKEKAKIASLIEKFEQLSNQFNQSHN